MLSKANNRVWLVGLLGLLGAASLVAQDTPLTNSSVKIDLPEELRETVTAAFRELLMNAVEWGGGGASTFPVQLSIKAKDRAGLLAEITAVISGAGSNIRNLESRPDRNNARIEASLEIADKRQLETIFVNIRRINGVFGVERVYQAAEGSAPN